MSLAPEEIKAVQWLFAFMPERPVIVDVGSNKGTWSDIFLDEYGDNCEVHLFEPNGLLLNYTRVKYDYKTNIAYNCCAIANDESIWDFWQFNDKHSGLSSLLHNQKWDYLNPAKTEVPSTTLDNYCLRESIDHVNFVKLDIEGAELIALKGMLDMFTDNRIDVVQIEYSEHWGIWNKTIDDLKEFAERVGYFVYQWRDGFVPLTDRVSDLENIYLTKLPIQNLSTGWNKPFIENTKDIKFNLGIECGSAEGLTAKYMCENMLTGQDARLIVIDPLRDYYIKENDMPELVGQYQRWQANTKRLPINLYREKSETAWDKLKDLRPQFFYLDGDHSEEAVYNDGVNAIRIAEHGAYILFDDYDGWSEGTTRGIDRILEKYSALIRIVKKNYQVLIQKI